MELAVTGAALFDNMSTKWPQITIGVTVLNDKHVCYMLLCLLAAPTSSCMLGCHAMLTHCDAIISVHRLLRQRGVLAVELSFLLTYVFRGVQEHPGGYQADSKVSENVLGTELWNAAQVKVHAGTLECLPLPSWLDYACVMRVC